MIEEKSDFKRDKESFKNFLYLIFNRISMVGVFFLVSGLLGGLFMLFLEIMGDGASGYLSLLLIPCFVLMAAGILLVTLGVIREKNRREAGEQPDVIWIFLKNRPYAAFLSIALVAISLIILLGTGSYKGYQWSESTSFCGQLCHTPMNPVWVTYQGSSHARVKCVECHIGEGTEWFVRSKISGMNQLVAVAFDSFARPIPTPVKNLRPARETCEKCHWPNKFIGIRQKVLSYYLSDENNSPYKIRMFLKVGGEKRIKSQGEGIHYHMLLSTKVDYIARDEKRQDIAWVRMTHEDGSVTEFNKTKNPLTEEEKKTMTIRSMDCLDCHNRPAHQYRTPMDMVNEFMDGDLISHTLPFMKLEAVRVLDGKYKTLIDAESGIKNHITEYYKNNYPKIYQNRLSEIEQSIAGIQNIYRQSIFPEMNAKWSAYPNNLSHRDWPGCFRCHSDELVSDKGEIIFKDCKGCHIILAQGENVTKPGKVDFVEGKPYMHPNEADNTEDFIFCYDCHTGGIGTYEDSGDDSDKDSEEEADGESGE